MTKRVHKQTIESLNRIRNWITCYFPIGMEPELFDTRIKLNGWNVGGLKSAVLECTEAIERLALDDIPKSRTAKKARAK